MVSDRCADRSLQVQMNDTSLARFWSRVDRNREDGCWIWGGAPNSSGYGRFRVGGAGSNDIPAHRYSYRCLVGHVETWRHLHHVCGVKLCVNPEHLTVTRAGEHNRKYHRRSTCVEGHSLDDPDNVYRHGTTRHCRACRRMSDRRRLGIPHERWKIDDQY